MQIAWDLYDTNEFNNYWLSWYYSSEYGYLLPKGWEVMGAIGHFHNKHEFGNSNLLTSKISKIPSLENKGVELGSTIWVGGTHRAGFCK